MTKSEAETASDKRRRQLVERYFINSGCPAQPIRLAWLWFTAVRSDIYLNFSPPHTYEQSVVGWADLFMFVLLCKMPFTAHQRGLISIQICGNQTSKPRHECRVGASCSRQGRFASPAPPARFSGWQVPSIPCCTNKAIHDIFLNCMQN